MAVILTAVAYAVITNSELKVKGGGSAKAEQENFKVQFIGTPTIDGKGIMTATIDSSDKTKGTINVGGLTAKGDEAVATYIVKNLSADLSTDLTADATSSNEEYFEVICALERTSLKAQEETTLKVTVRLLKTPIDETKENLSSNIGVSIIAEPKKTGDEANEGSETVSSKKTTKPYLPTGFTQVKGTTLKNGITIQDSNGNQYVWVEVPMTDEVYQTAGLSITNFTEEEYTTIENDLHTYTKNYRKDGYIDEYFENGISGFTKEKYVELKQKMLKSIYKNGGFYVGKYETGIENEPKTDVTESEIPTEVPVIKQNAYPYNNITWNQAQILADKMGSGKYTSSLLFGVQWDLMLKYLETKGVSEAELNEDSTSWGNTGRDFTITNPNSKYSINAEDWISKAYGYKDGNTRILLSTGASEDFGKQGIYDLAGNLFEWTLEKTPSESNPCTWRGGVYSGNCPAVFRNNCITTVGLNFVGFRISIY